MDKPNDLSLLRQIRRNFKSLRPCNLKNCTRKEVKDYFENSYNLDEAIFTGLKDEKYIYKCPDRLRLPLIFYLAHTATLYVNKLLLAGLIKERIDRKFETMFETGVDEMSWDDTENYRMGGAYEWPSFSTVMDYRHKVREMVINVIETAPLDYPITPEHPWWSIFMGMEHERIHLETSSVLLRQLPREFLQRPDNWEYAPAMSPSGPAGPNKFISVPEGDAVLGKPKEFPTYGWDNEYGNTKIHVPAFEATQFLITNGEFLQFVENGGYQKRELWSDEGWKWVQFRQATHPSFWVCHKGCKSGCGSDLSTYSHCTLPEPDTDSTNCSQYKYRAMYDLIDLPVDWPVDVNNHEAKAFCKWKGPQFRLVTEAEHHRIRAEQDPTADVDCDYICGQDEFPYNINMKFGSSTPVNYFPPNSMGFYDTYGNVWEWVEDHFNGLPQFRTSYLYDDFSSPCFDGRHTMIQGGSWVSTGDEASRFARFSFRRHFFQHLGFRLARSLTNECTPVRLCKADVFDESGANIPSIVNADPNLCSVPSTNTHFIYDKLTVTETLIMKELGTEADYGRPLIEFCEQKVNEAKCPKDNALVFGCGPGFTSFLLTNIFTNVVGVDYGGRLISIAKELQRTGEYVIGDNRIKVEQLFDSVKTENVTFKQLTWTPNEIEGFNFVLFEHLDRLMEPKGWLLKLWECVEPNGVLVVSASNKWNSHILKDYIGEWFDLTDERTICTKCVTTWRRVQDC